jgi:hypothetical protein
MPDGMSMLADVEPTRGRVALPLLALLAIVFAGALLAGAVDIDSELVVDDVTSWVDEEYIISSNVTVAQGGVLNVTNATLTFETDVNGSIGITVEEGGTLLIEGSTCQASDMYYFFLALGDTVVRDCSLSGLYGKVFDPEPFSEMAGGLKVDGGSLTLEDVTMDANGIHLTVHEADLVADRLALNGGDVGMLVYNSTGTLSNVTIHNVTYAIGAEGSELAFYDLEMDLVYYGLTSSEGDITIHRARSQAGTSHIIAENGTTRVIDSTFTGGSEAVIGILGHLEVRGCTFRNMSTAIELLYAEGIITDVLVDGHYSKGIVLSHVGYDKVVPEFTFDNVTLRNGWDSAVDIESCSNITLVGLAVENSGEGVHMANSVISIVDSTITDSVVCPVGCDGVASATGIVLETSTVVLQGVDIVGSQGPALSSYFSAINATSCTFSDGGASALVLVYSWLLMTDGVVTGNAAWGVEALASWLDPEELTGTWDNALADVRMNMTINVKVVDDTGMWLSHAAVTAVSGTTSVGPQLTGFGGSTSTFELPIYEYDYDTGNHSFNPWTFKVDYGAFNNSTEVELVRGVGRITLEVPVKRADLVVERLVLGDTREPGETMNLRATVVNSGNYTVDSAMLTFYFRNEAGFQRVIGETTVGPLEPGESTNGRVEWIPIDEGTFAIVAFVDVDDLVDEEDDDNNRIEREVEIKADEGGIPGPSVAMAVVAVSILAIALSVRSRRS